MKQAIYRTARRLGSFALANRFTRRGLRILAYHGLWVTPGYAYGDRLFMKPGQFERRMKRLKTSGRPVLPLGEAVRLLAADEHPDGSVVVTIDDGWASTPLMIDIMAQYDLPATVYVTTARVATQAPNPHKTADYIVKAADGRIRPPADELDEEGLVALSAAAGVPLDWLDTRQFHVMTKTEIATLRDLGVDIQLHTHGHRMRELDEGLTLNRRTLEDCGIDGNELRHFCYPSGFVTDEAASVLRQHDILSATTCEHGINYTANHNPYELRRFLDGRSVSEAEFDAYLCGFQHLVDDMRTRIGMSAVRPASGSP